MTKTAKKKSVPVEVTYVARSKRRKSSGDAVAVVVDQTSALACKALTIVLQYFMIPNLGWSMNSLEKQSLQGKLDILNFLNTLPDSEEKEDAISSIKDSTLIQNAEKIKFIAGKLKDRVAGISDVFMTFNIHVSRRDTFYSFH